MESYLQNIKQQLMMDLIDGSDIYINDYKIDVKHCLIAFVNLLVKLANINKNIRANECISLIKKIR
jgi:virulence-associated protein VapD